MYIIQDRTVKYEDPSCRNRFAPHQHMRELRSVFARAGLFRAYPNSFARDGKWGSLPWRWQRTWFLLRERGRADEGGRSKYALLFLRDQRPDPL